ncbi:MAG: helix-turn-helix domain-containing protein [Cyclobacteriaceae bacterium]|nr:helix-turn-helix domain-containing protein [Cyclobacteriaceae bacterium]
MKKYPGFFSFYWDDQEGKIFIEIDKLDLEFLYYNSLSAGMGSNDVGLDRGRVGDGKVLSFTRSGPKVLLVEDHHELAAYLIKHLEKNYRLINATDGNQGLLLAREHLPDLLITDLMMPKTDGITLINRLKNDPLTENIPVIVLSAKTSFTGKVESYRGGAVAYLTKPVLVDELNLVIHNLLKFKQEFVEKRDEGNGNLKKVEDTFYQEFAKLVEIQMADPDFTIHNLAKKLAVSRTQLHRKIKTVSGSSAMLVIRSIKMQKAHQLLQEGKSVKEVAFSTGYTSISQFSKMFKAHFGRTPTEVKGSSGGCQNL